MTPEKESLHLIRTEVWAAYTSLTSAREDRADCRESVCAIGKCLDQLRHCGAECLPSVKLLLGDAHTALLGRKNVNRAMQAIRRASQHIETAINEQQKTAGLTAA